jgi:hypothetical protein
MANAFASYLRKNVGTTENIVLTVPTSTVITVVGLTMTNVITATIKADVYIRRGGIDYFILKDTDILAGSAQVPIGGDQKVILLAGDALIVKSNTANSLDVVLSTLNIT